MKTILFFSASALLSLQVSALGGDSLISGPPCRVIDTRKPGTGGALAPATPRHFVIAGTTGFEAQGGTAGGCGTPANIEVTAVLLNVVAVSPSGPGHLQAWGFGQAMPAGSVLNYSAATATGGLNIANTTVIRFTHTFPDPHITIRAGVSGTHVVADVMGWYTTQATNSSQLGGKPAADYMLKFETAFDSHRVGGKTLDDLDDRYLGEDATASNSHKLGGQTLENLDTRYAPAQTCPRPAITVSTTSGPYCGIHLSSAADSDLISLPFNHLQNTFFLLISRTQGAVRWGNRGTLVYESADCSGPPFIVGYDGLQTGPTRHFAVLPEAYDHPLGAQKYLYVANTGISAIAVQSTRNSSSCDTYEPYPANAHAVISTSPLPGITGLQ